MFRVWVLLLTLFVVCFCNFGLFVLLFWLVCDPFFLFLFWSFVIDAFQLLFLLFFLYLFKKVAQTKISAIIPSGVIT